MSIASKSRHGPSLLDSRKIMIKIESGRLRPRLAFSSAFPSATNLFVSH